MKYNYKVGVLNPFAQSHKRIATALVAVVFAFLWYWAMFGMVSAAVTPWTQGFEVDASGWLDDDDLPGYGNIDRVPSGTDGVASSSGDFHAEVTEQYPFSRFDGYRDVWPGTWTAEIDVYLDPAWAAGEGFDYSVAANGSDNAHQRDYIFHVTSDTSDEALYVAGSNNTNFVPREDLENVNHYEVTSAGWYTLQHVFYDNGGTLDVDLNLLDDSGTVLFTETRTGGGDDVMANIGGNRYAWFTAMNIEDGLHVDNHELTLNEAIYPTTGEITSPLEDEVVSGEVTLAAIYDDGDNDNDDALNWAVRPSTNNCGGGTGTLFGGGPQVSGIQYPNLSESWDGSSFEAVVDSTLLEDGEYCFVFNPTDDEGENNVREVVHFTVDNRADNKDECKNGGWVLGLDLETSFRNQGDCVSHFVSATQMERNPDGGRNENGNGRR